MSSAALIATVVAVVVIAVCVTVTVVIIRRRRLRARVYAVQHAAAGMDENITIVGVYQMNLRLPAQSSSAATSARATTSSQPNTGHNTNNHHNGIPNGASSAVIDALSTTRSPRVGGASTNRGNGNGEEAIPGTPTGGGGVANAILAQHNSGGHARGHGSGSITSGSGTIPAGVIDGSSPTPRDTRASVISIASTTTTTTTTTGSGGGVPALPVTVGATVASDVAVLSARQSSSPPPFPSSHTTSPPPANASSPMRISLKSKVMRTAASNQRVTAAARAAASGELTRGGPMTVEQLLADQFYRTTGQSLHARAASQSSVTSYTGPVKHMTINVLADTPEPSDIRHVNRRTSNGDTPVNDHEHHSIIVDAGSSVAHTYNSGYDTMMMDGNTSFSYDTPPLPYMPVTGQQSPQYSSGYSPQRDTHSNASSPIMASSSSSPTGGTPMKPLVNISSRRYVNNMRTLDAEEHAIKDTPTVGAIVAASIPTSPPKMIKGAGKEDSNNNNNNGASSARMGVTSDDSRSSRLAAAAQPDSGRAITDSDV